MPFLQPPVGAILAKKPFIRGFKLGLKVFKLGQAIIGSLDLERL